MTLLGNNNIAKNVRGLYQNVAVSVWWSKDNSYSSNFYEKISILDEKNFIGMHLLESIINKLYYHYPEL